jgi:hypothetical protein
MPLMGQGGEEVHCETILTVLDISKTATSVETEQQYSRKERRLRPRQLGDVDMLQERTLAMEGMIGENREGKDDDDASNTSTRGQERLIYYRPADLRIRIH